MLNQSAFSKEFIDAVDEVFRLHMMKLRWLVPPVKSLSVGQGYRPVPNKKRTISGFNTTHFKRAPWNINPNKENEAGENIYRIPVNLISPMDYLRLPSHLAEMARVDKIAALCKGKRDDIKGVEGAFTDGAGNALVLQDSVSRPGEPEIESVRTFLGCWSNRDRWMGPMSPEYWDDWMSGNDKVMDHYIDGSTTDYADGLRGNGYWNWPIKFNAVTGKMYYNPKINPRSTNEVETILNNISSGKVSDQPAVKDPINTKPSPVLTPEPLPATTPPKNPNKDIAKPKKKAHVNRNKAVPISKLKKKK
jgi:hypothetical protein